MDYMGLFMDTCPHNPTGCWFLGIISCELQVRTDELMFVLLEQPHQVRSGISVKLMTDGLGSGADFRC